VALRLPVRTTRSLQATDSRNSNWVDCTDSANDVTITGHTGLADVGGNIGMSGAMWISLAAQLSADDVITLPDVRRVRGGAVGAVGSGGSSSTYPG